MALTKVPSNLDSVTATTQSQGDGSTNVATTAYVDTGLNALIDSAPGNLNTLNELAAAMNDNASFFSTVLPLSGGTMTGNLTVTSTTASTTGMVRLQNNMDNGYEALRIESLGNYDASIGFFADGSSNYYWGAGIDYSDSGKFKISNDNIVSVNTRLTITTGGNVGIGETNPDASLHITSNTPTIAFDESDASQDWRIGSYGGSFAIYDETDSQFRLVVNGSGNVGIGTTSINANAKLHVQDSSGSYPDDTNNHLVVESASHSYIGIGGGTSSDVGIHMGDSGGINRGKLAYLNASDSMVLFTSAQERMRITSNGSITVGGGGSPRSVGWGDTKFQIEGTSATDSSISLIRNEAGNNPPYFVFAKSRGSSIGSSTVVQNNDDLGSLRWVAADGAGLENQAAQISAQVDGTAGNNDTPGRLMFFTSPDGSNSAQERMRITAAGEHVRKFQQNGRTQFTERHHNGSGDILLDFRRFYHTSSNFNNPTINLLILTANNVNYCQACIYVKVRQMGISVNRAILAEGFCSHEKDANANWQFSSAINTQSGNSSPSYTSSAYDFWPIGRTNTNANPNWYFSTSGQSRTVGVTLVRSTNYDQYIIEVEVFAHQNMAFTWQV